MACFKPRPTAINHGQYTIFFRVFFVVLTIAILIEMVLVIVLMSFPTSDRKLFNLNIALLEVAPNSSSGRGAPIFSMGLLRSCARVNDASPISCTTLKTPPRHDFSVLSPVEGKLRDAIPILAVAIIWTGLGLWVLFFVSIFRLALDAQYEGRYRREIDELITISAGLGFFGALFPLVIWWFLSRLFGKLVKIFDHSQNKFTAATGKAFPLIFGVYLSMVGTAFITMVFFWFYTATAKDPPNDMVKGPPGGTTQNSPGGIGQLVNNPTSDVTPGRSQFRSRE